jgi:rfaE bifunctional protein nucleotidyltransferase chain/domain/rfaE bifunctional protein kinase chain/domain
MSIVVIGDTLLDLDLAGTAERLSPDAPVPVVADVHEQARAGGAGLAATMAARLSGTEVVLVTALGTDPHAERLAGLLDDVDVEVVPLPLRGETVRKTRVLAAGRPVVRVDRGDGRLAEEPLSARAVKVISQADVVLVADYGRGVAGHPAIRCLLSGRVVWDPHLRGARPVDGVTLVTPNRAEARAFAGGTEHRQPLDDAKTLVRRWGAAGVAVTLGESGAAFAEATGSSGIVPTATRASALSDPCGAGDCFAAAAALALMRGTSIEEAVTEGVRHASELVAFGRLGAGGWDVIRQVRARGGCVVATGGCFDLLHAGHVELLRQARALGDCLVVCLNSDESVRALKGPDRPLVEARDRAKVLAALDCVDAVMIFEERTPINLLERLAPDIWVKGGDYVTADLMEAPVVRRHGGEIVILPHLEGRSTSRLVERARGGGEAA